MYLPKPQKDKIINALRNARRYIRTVETWRKGYDAYTLDYTVDEFTEGNEIKAIEDALVELGVVI